MVDTNRLDLPETPLMQIHVRCARISQPRDALEETSETACDERPLPGALTRDGSQTPRPHCLVFSSAARRRSKEVKKSDALNPNRMTLSAPIDGLAADVASTGRRYGFDDLRKCPVPTVVALQATVPGTTTVASLQVLVEFSRRVELKPSIIASSIDEICGMADAVVLWITEHLRAV